MIRAKILFVVLAVFGGAAISNAQVQLKFKFEDGVKSATTSVTRTNQTLTIAGMEIVTSAEQTIIVSSTNGRRADDGQLVVSQKIDALKADLDIAGQQLSYDSATPDAPPPGTALDVVIDVFKAVNESAWTVTYDKNNTVTSVDGRDAALKSLPEELRKSTEKQFDPVYLAQLSNDEMATISKSPVQSGDTWNLKTTVRLEGGQTFTFDKMFRYEGSVNQSGKQLHKITETTTNVVYDMEANPASPLKFISSELKVAESEGTTLFDNEAGQVFSRHSKVHIVGPIVFEAGGNELPSTVDLTMEQTTKLTKP